MILLYSVLFIYLNSSSLISYTIFIGGFNSSDVEKKHLQILLMFLSGFLFLHGVVDSKVDSGPYPQFSLCKSHTLGWPCHKVYMTSDFLFSLHCVILDIKVGSIMCLCFT